MGEVYRARDTRLGRDVALKVLPAALSAHEECLRRFKQEACNASALNHPNIITVYEVGQRDATCYIATEFIDGETLRKDREERYQSSKELVVDSKSLKQELEFEAKSGRPSLLNESRPTAAGRRAARRAAPCTPPPVRPPSCTPRPSASCSSAKSGNTGRASR